MTTSASSPYSELGKQPLAGASPSGADVRGEPDFDLLQDEMAKLSSPSSSGTLDWNQVARLATTLLAEKGKDLLVASYLAGALLQTRGLPGLADGLGVLRDLLEQYWDTLFPPLQRLRGRRNALQWLAERIARQAEETDWSALPPQEPELVDTLRAHLEAIDAVLRDKDDDAPSLRPLLNLVNSLPLQERPQAPLPAALEEPAAPAAAAAERAAPAAASVAPSAPRPVAAPMPAQAAPASSTEADSVLEHACARLGEISAWWLESDLASPLAFRLGRIAAWAGLDALPPADGDSTRIPPPISQVVDALHQLVANQADEDLVRFAEAQLPAFPFWLDLNRISAQALQRLGERFGAAQREVCGETARLLARLPGLQALGFASGMPFADDDTRAWLATLAAPAAEGSAAPAGGADPVAGAVRNARALAAQGEVAAAAAGLQRLLAQTQAPAQKLLLRIRLCELLLAERPGANLRPFAEAVVAEIDRHDLARWDPPLALEGLRAAYRIYAEDEEKRALADALLARIVDLDAGQAVDLVTG